MIGQVAVYRRVSALSQVEGDSLDAQKEILFAYAKQHGYLVVADYEEAGHSARVSSRPAFQAMAAAAKSGRFEAVLLWKWDRFARNREDAVIYKMLFAQYGVHLIAVGEPQIDGSEGRLLEGIIDLVAEFQSATTAAHVKNTMLHNARQGRWQGLPPFGYRIDPQTGKLRIEAAEAAAVRWAFDAAARREKSLGEIAECFGRGRPHPVTLRYKWSVSAVRKLLANPAFVGVMRWNRRESLIVRAVEDGNIYSRKAVQYRDPSEWIEVVDAHPAIVGAEVFNFVQGLLSRQSLIRARGRKAGEYIFRGLCKCSRCGGNLVYQQNRNEPIRLVCSRYYYSLDSCRPFNWIHLGEIEIIISRSATKITEHAAIDQLEMVVGAGRQPAKEPDWQERQQRLLKLYVAGLIDFAEFERQRQAIVEERTRWQTENCGPTGQMPSFEQVRAQLSRIHTILYNADIPVETKNSALHAVIDRIMIDRVRRTIKIFWLMPFGN